MVRIPTIEITSIGIPSELAHVVQTDPSRRSDVMRNLLGLLLQSTECLYTRGAIADDCNAFIMAICRLIPTTSVQDFSLEFVQSRNRGLQRRAEVSQPEVERPCSIEPYF